MKAILAVAGIFLLVVVIFLIAWYVIESLFVYKLSKMEGTKYPWLAWIPFLRSINYFEMMDGETFSIMGFELEKKNAMIIYVCWPIISWALSLIWSGFSVLLSVFFIVISCYVYMTLFNDLKNDYAFALSVISAIGFSPIVFIIVYSQRKKYRENNVDVVIEQ